MTRRIEQPDTDADLQLRECLDQNTLRNFVMIAGAGSGKTTSLVKALDHLERTRGLELRRRSQQIACITYTEVAVGEIWGDVGNSSLFHVSTIHSFLWVIVQSYQKNIHEWVTVRIHEKIQTSQEKIDRPKTREATRAKLQNDIVRYQTQLTNLANITRFKYGMGSDYSNGILGHDDILKIGPALINEYPLLRTIVANRYPFIFIDESQDTNPSFVEALKLIASTNDGNFCLGFFGDPMQKIYTTGAGPIAINDEWNEITKPENFRCPTSVMHLINRIRSEDDGLEQIRGRTSEHTGIAQPVEGTARLFIFPADDRRSERLSELRNWLARQNDDPLWESDNKEADVRVLVIVHRMAARRLGFENIYAALNDNGATSLKDGLLDGTAWVLRPFIKYILPLVLSARKGDDFDVITSLKTHCQLLTKESIQGQNSAELLNRLNLSVTHLIELLSDERDSTIRDILNFIHSQELMILDDRFIQFLENIEIEWPEDEANTHDAAVTAFLDCPAKQLWGYYTYIEDQSPFATQQGIKGAEFQRVLVILDDEEGRYNLFSYGKYLGITPLSATDQKNIDNGEDSVLGRTRRLFYVCCSRATQDLAVVLFVPDVAQARTAVITKGLFTERNIHIFND